MATPRMCDVCEKIKPARQINNALQAPDSGLPDGWRYISIAGGARTHNGELCSQACAVNYVDRLWGDGNKQ